ncbi:hypothetical protein HDU85_005870 [Gaertneriomyces sp. JEL0708]|nr:hypothetical protein HDU85_005870 [Gaertneriomyces sp. JEL0708]
MITSPMLGPPPAHREAFIIIHETTRVDVYGPYTDLQEANHHARRLATEIYLSSSNTISPSSFSSSTTDAITSLEEYELRKTECGMVTFLGAKGGRVVSVRVLRQGHGWTTPVETLQTKLAMLTSTLHHLANHLHLNDLTQIPDRVSTLLADHHALKTTYTNLQSDFTSQTSRVESLSEQLERAHSDRLLIAQRYDALQTQHQTLFQDHETISDEKHKLELKLQLLQDQQQHQQTSHNHTTPPEIESTELYKQLERDHQKLRHRLKGLGNKYIYQKQRLFAAEEEVKRLKGY